MADQQNLTSNNTINVSATIFMQQLQTLIQTHPWFKNCETEKWLQIDAEVINNLNQKYEAQYQQTITQISKGQTLTFTDKRFADDKWQIPAFNLIAQIYLQYCNLGFELIALMPITPLKAQKRLNFLLEQSFAAAAPSNFLWTNPEALAKARETSGFSLQQGLAYLLADLSEGKLRHCPKNAFKLGQNVATTKGQIVFSNELLQLIQYYPTTQKQHLKPIFIVPPCINKFYILDLRPENSLVKHLLDQGFSVFLISWRNFGAKQAHLTADNFVQDGVITAMRTARAISGVKDLNCVGFCIGGTLLSMALAVLQDRFDQNVGSLTLLTTFLDYADTGILDIFIDEEFVALCEKLVGGLGQLPPQIFRGEIMGATFSLLRPNELWWNYVASKYLQGKQPKPFDLLYWNNDSTSLPGPMFCWYLREAYLNNALKSGNLRIAGNVLDFSSIKVPSYIYASIDDHIVPWRTAFNNVHLLGGKCDFVLGASGHIAGVINPPAANKRHFWTNSVQEKSADLWLKNATQTAGSWWNNWFAWLKKHNTEDLIISRVPNSAEYPNLENAPGSYVLETFTL